MLFLQNPQTSENVNVWEGWDSEAHVSLDVTHSNLTRLSPHLLGGVLSWIY